MISIPAVFFISDSILEILSTMICTSFSEEKDELIERMRGE